ncbi:sigma-54 interaction domain-containing protein [Terriglobus roseus]|uniref:Sigma-54 interaction domain-containing protein n=1 Tax=Terriglobus roseus TaxID=392734 RepID=A0A1H4SI41_9BACT|nr:sigma-54 dependent transcriptional regulator [Terriglobus roseus]SEC43768.1 Sigma-54 interaction domain-containing protein [Terriglobus roseus]
MTAHFFILALGVHREISDILHRASRLPNLVVASASYFQEAVSICENSRVPPGLIICESSSTAETQAKKIEALSQLATDATILVVSDDVSLVQVSAQSNVCNVSRAKLLQEIVARINRPRNAPATPATSPSPANALASSMPHVVHFAGGGFMLAASPAMFKVTRQLETIAPHDVPVLITGESGVGKEMVAKLVHHLSHRSAHPFMKVNCAALPHDLLESELFGYEAGAFSGATKSKPGKFEQCDGGTLLLDELGEMSPALQAKLLHVLQDGTFSRLGSRGESKVDVRIIAATNIDIAEAIKGNRFREDLYYRLNVFSFHIPPLRERRMEIPYLAQYITADIARAYKVDPIDYSPSLMEKMMNYRWPGNVREFANFIKRYLILRDEGQAMTDLIVPGCASVQDPMVIFPALPGPATYAAEVHDIPVDRTMEAEELRLLLNRTHWNRRVAAEQLNMRYRDFLGKMKRCGLDSYSSLDRAGI